MAEPLTSYHAQVSGLWAPRHTIWKDRERLGELGVRRSSGALITGATYTPVQGEVLHLRRDPGILRSQYSLWTDGREWLGSSLRWSFVGREISLSTGNKPYRLIPLPTFRRGWRLVAPKTGELARIEPRFARRGSTIDVYRKVDFELVLFAYFLGSLLYAESWWPAHAPEDESASLGSPSKA
jgi:hypothetical protein